MKIEEYKVGDIVIFNGRRPWIFNGVSEDGNLFYITDDLVNVIGMKLEDGTEVTTQKGYAYPVKEFYKLISFYARPMYHNLTNIFCNMEKDHE